MLKNYLKIAVRTILRNKVYSFINIFGLSVGLACCFLILLFVRNELSYDSFHKNADSIYRVSLFENYSKDDQHFNSITPAILGPTLEQYFPEVKNTVRISKFPGLVKTENKSFPEKYTLADKDFFTMFNFPLLKGRPGDVLANPNSAVLTESLAKKYFGDENPLGKTISIKLDNEQKNFIVTGIAKNVPSNSSIQFNIVIPFYNLKSMVSDRAFNSWTTIFCETYVFTKPGVTGKQMDAKMPSMVKAIEGSNYKAGTYNLLFQPIKDIHLDDKFPAGLEPISSPVYSYILSIIGILILLIASVNFITLSIGKSVSRAGEVGVRKVIGANRRQLIQQYWGESLLIVVISTMIGLLISELLLPFFNEISGKDLRLIYDPSILGIILLLVIITGLLAGIYPAVILSSYKPVEVLKGKLSINKRSRLRRILVCGQFALSVIMISCTIVVSNQLSFIKDKSLGFSKENVVVIPTGMNISETFRTAGLFRNILSSDKNVISISSAATPLGDKWSMIGFDMENNSYGRFYMNAVDYDYLKTMDIRLLNGRDFSPKYPSDEDHSVIVNEAFIKHFGLQNDPDGKMPGRFDNCKIIGVVKDFNFESLHTKIKPALLALKTDPIFQPANDIDPDFNPRIIIRINSRNTQATLEKLKGTWSKLVPQIPFKYSFLDDNINNQYKAEERLTTIITSSSLLSIIITCLGLFGLTTLITSQKTKEIGIRRLLGASTASIYKILSKEFVGLILAAQIIGIPVAWYLLNMWLDDFAYRITLQPYMFIAAGIITIIIATATISFQSVKAATANPVESLRYE